MNQRLSRVKSPRMTAKIRALAKITINQFENVMDLAPLGPF